jgi:5-methylcytosine-specific restriction endonuclease McrA
MGLRRVRSRRASAIDYTGLAIPKPTRRQTAHDQAKAYAAVDRRDRGYCRACQQATTHDGPVARARHHHHLVYRSRGGAHTVENIITLCGACHRALHDGKLQVTGTPEPGGLTWTKHTSQWKG